MTNAKQIPHFDSVKEAEQTYAYTLLRLQKVLRSRKVDAMTGNLIAELVKIVAGMREVQNLRYAYADKMVIDLMAYWHGLLYVLDLDPMPEEMKEWQRENQVRLSVYSQVTNELNGTNNREHA